MVGEIPKWMAKAEPIVYLRISSKEQAGADMGKAPEKMETLQSQLAIVKQGLKDAGFKMPKKADIFYEVVSGGDLPDNRPVWNEMINHALAKKGRTFIAVKEPARWARDQTWGEEAYAPLKRAEIPLFASLDGLLTSTVNEPRATEHFFWSIKAGVSESERSVIKQKAKSKVRELREAGIYPAGGPILYPFSLSDPLDEMNKHAFKANLKPSEGGLSKQAVGLLIQNATAPHGPKAAWWKKEIVRDLERKEKLNNSEYKQWYDFRKKVREIEKLYDYDGSALKDKDGRKGTVHWGIKALRRFANGYLAQPFSKLYSMPTDEQIEEYLKNPVPYLSASDKKLYTKLVSKR